MLQPQQVKDRGMPIVNVDRIFDGFVTVFVSCAVRDPAFPWTATFATLPAHLRRSHFIGVDLTVFVGPLPDSLQYFSCLVVEQKVLASQIQLLR